MMDLGRRGLDFDRYRGFEPIESDSLIRAIGVNSLQCNNICPTSCDNLFPYALQ